MDRYLDSLSRPELQQVPEAQGLKLKLSRFDLRHLVMQRLAIMLVQASYRDCMSDQHLGAA
jgi:hypothetical protein